jgi:hypothetical protein
MCHAWTLLYGCCWLMLLPSLLAWLQLPLGESDAIALPADISLHMVNHRQAWILRCVLCLLIDELQANSCYPFVHA